MNWRNGGAAVGAGFAVFESAGYAMRYYIMGLLVGGSSMGYDTMLDVIYGRAILSPGGHIAWAAFSGATLIIVMEKAEFNRSIPSKAYDFSCTDMDCYIGIAT